MMSEIIYCRWAPSLGKLEGKHQKAWGTEDYKWWRNRNEPTVFFGLYDLRDYLALWAHRGKAWVLWAGSDIKNLRSDFFFNDGKLKWLSELFAMRSGSLRDWLIRKVLVKAEHWVENEAEAWQLKDTGLKVSGIQQSFLGRVSDYKSAFRPGRDVYVSCGKGRQDEYGFGIVQVIASSCPKIRFHLYGDTLGQFCQPQKNVIQHGWVPKGEMNKQIRRMQCGLRLNKHDGFSEITAKSVLWGQYPITYLYFPRVTQYAADDVGYPGTLKSLNRLVKLLNGIPKKKRPNLAARNWYRRNLNRYPWVTKDNV